MHNITNSENLGSIGHQKCKKITEQLRWMFFFFLLSTGRKVSFYGTNYLDYLPIMSSAFKIFVCGSVYCYSLYSVKICQSVILFKNKGGLKYRG